MTQPDIQFGGPRRPNNRQRIEAVERAIDPLIDLHIALEQMVCEKLGISRGELIARAQQIHAARYAPRGIGPELWIPKPDANPGGVKLP